VVEAVRARYGRACARVDSESVVRLEPSAIGAVVRCGALRVAALFRRGSLLWSTALPRADVGSFRRSPHGGYFAVAGGRRLLVVDAYGRPVPLPVDAVGARAIAWSPDERWTAVATPRGVSVFATTKRRRPRIAELPISAYELAWR
jgi:hypothetical protein